MLLGWVNTLVRILYFVIFTAWPVFLSHHTKLQQLCSSYYNTMKKIHTFQAYIRRSCGPSLPFSFCYTWQCSSIFDGDGTASEQQYQYQQQYMITLFFLRWTVCRAMCHSRLCILACGWKKIFLGVRLTINPTVIIVVLLNASLVGNGNWCLVYAHQRIEVSFLLLVKSECLGIGV